MFIFDHFDSLIRSLVDVSPPPLRPSSLKCEAMPICGHVPLQEDFTVVLFLHDTYNVGFLYVSLLVLAKLRALGIKT